MKPIIFKPHSIVDVITNSSTTVYVMFHTGAIKYTYELINEVLKVAGSAKKAEDLFDVELCPDITYLYDFVVESCTDIDDLQIEEDVKNFLKECKDKYKDNYEDGYEEFKKWKETQDMDIEDVLLKGNLWKEFVDDEDCFDVSIKITAKDQSKSTRNLGALISNMFDCEASYEG